MISESKGPGVAAHSKLLVLLLSTIATEICVVLSFCLFSVDQTLFLPHGPLNITDRLTQNTYQPVLSHPSVATKQGRLASLVLLRTFSK